LTGKVLITTFYEQKNYCIVCLNVYNIIKVILLNSKYSDTQSDFLSDKAKSAVNT